MADLTTVDAAKEWAGIKTSTDDGLLARLVSAASAFVEQAISRPVLEASYTETLHGTGRDVLMLEHYPIVSVASVTVDGAAQAPRASVGDGGFTFDERMLYLDGGCFTRGRRNVVVQYTAGYESVPAELEQATLEVVGLLYKSRDRIGHTSATLQGQTVAFLVRELPVHVQKTLDQWRRVL